MKQKHNRVTLIKRFAKGSIHFFSFAIVASIINIILNAMTPQIIKVTVDSILGDEPFDLPSFLMPILYQIGGKNYLQSHLIFIAGVIIVIALLSGLFNYLCRVNISKGSESFVKKVRDTLFSHVQNLPYTWHVKHQTGDIIQRCTSDVEVIRNFVSSQLLEVFRTSFLIIFSLFIMFTMNVKMSFVALAFIPIVIAYSGVFYGKIAKRFLVADEAEGELSSVVQENLTGVRVVRAFGREQFEIERFDNKNKKFADLWINLGYLTGAYWGLGDFITGLQILTVMIIGVFEAVGGQITVGGFIAFISYNATLVWPIRGLGRIISDMSKAGVSFDRVDYILNQEEEKDCQNALTPPLNQDIEFSHIHFQYEGLQPILADIDFTVKAGSTIGILGGTGSGKSTLMHLLNRLYDLPEGCGEIKIGGININQMKRDWLRSNIGMVLQEPFLFSRTIKENINAARPEADFNETRRMASIACVDDAISGFSGGYDTIVGERGVTLSGGQKQRVAIARMLLQQSPIMVFDDSLSAVDSETDYKIRTALKESLGESTVILISHRITTLMQADQIIVLEEGKIAEMGSHQELIEKEGIYKDIYDIQMSNDDRLFTQKEGL